jgi:hypothetical protein
MSDVSVPYPMDELPWRDLVRVLALREMGRGSAADVVQWAGDALAEGRDSPSLRVLAGLSPPLSGYEVDRHLRDATGELGVSVPDRETLLALFARLVARGIVDGSVSPESGVKDIYEAFRLGDSFVELGVWTGLDDALVMARDGVFGSIQDAEDAIVQEAKRLLSTTPSR